MRLGWWSRFQWWSLSVVLTLPRHVPHTGVCAIRPPNELQGRVSAAGGGWDLILSRQRPTLVFTCLLANALPPTRSAAKGKTLKPASSKKERVPSAKGKTVGAGRFGACSGTSKHTHLQPTSCFQTQPAKSNTGGKTPAKRGGKGAGSGDAGGAVGGWAYPPQQQRTCPPP